MNFVIRKVNGKWLIESRINDKLEISEHASRVKALNSLFCKYPGIKQFFVILPETEVK